MTTTTMPRRITTLQWVRASLAVRLGLEPEYEGADTLGWAQQLRDMRLADAKPTISRPAEVATAFVPPVRRTAAALAAVPYELVDVPHLGVLPLGPLEPARLFNARRYGQIGAAA